MKCPNRNSTLQTMSDGSELRSAKWPRMDPSQSHARRRPSSASPRLQTLGRASAMDAFGRGCV